MPLVIDSNYFPGLQRVKYVPDLDRVVVCDKSGKSGGVKILRFFTFNNEKGLRLVRVPYFFFFLLLINYLLCQGIKRTHRHRA